MASLDVTASLIQSLQEEQTRLLSTLQQMQPQRCPPNNDVLLWLQYAQQSGSKTLLTLAQRLERVDAALCSFNLGLYGLCADCEEPIEPAILASDPAEPRCAHCRIEDHYHHSH